MTSEPPFAAVVGAYRRDLGSRLDEIASLRRRAAELGPAVGSDVQELLEVVSSSVRRSAEASEVLVQWLQAQGVEASSGESKVSRLQG